MRPGKLKDPVNWFTINRGLTVFVESVEFEVKFGVASSDKILHF